MHAAAVTALFLISLCCGGLGRVVMAKSHSTPKGSAQADIWTSGPILKAVNELNLYPDSKTYVDCPVKESQELTLAAIKELSDSRGGKLDKGTLQQFLDEHFDEPGSELHNFTAPDFVPDPPSFLPLVTNESILEWGLAVHKLWNVLARKADPSVAETPEKHSLLPLPNPAIVAGDRFRETYYWDSFFIIRGLLDVIKNLTHLLKTYGIVPNGARTYYLNRSQPPLLSEMIRIVFEDTNDKAFLESQFSSLELEYEYWTQAPMQVTVIKNDIPYNLSRYWSTLRSPRPESFREDTETAKGLSPETAEELWHNLASAAASGWDFSSRWFKDGRNLTTCQTSLHLPTDLNAFLFRLESNLADFAKVLGKDNSVYHKAAAARLEAINALMWNEGTGQWHDLVIAEMDKNGQVSKYDLQSRTYVSNWVPLWAGVASPLSKIALKACDSFKTSGLIQQGGVMTSLYDTSQQWDAPNAWPPLQYFMVDGLRRFGDESARVLSRQLVQAWLASNHAGYLQNGRVMSEKYNAMAAGKAGGGGEYSVQIGFGWTNGVMLHFLQEYGWSPSQQLPDAYLRNIKTLSLP